MSAEPMTRTIADEPFWRRQNAPLADVSYPRRTIELVVMPYDEPATVPWQGRYVQETIARGAFDGIERRANRVSVNRDHRTDVENTIGRAVSFHPSRDEGLVAEVKISRTTKGDEALELAADGCLDASAAFMPLRGAPGDGMEWHGRDAYTVTKAWLGHIALTPEPAYPGARVLAVRSTGLAAPLTPNLDDARAWLASWRAASLTSA